MGDMVIHSPLAVILVFDIGRILTLQVSIGIQRRRCRIRATFSLELRLLLLDLCATLRLRSPLRSRLSSTWRFDLRNRCVLSICSRTFGIAANNLDFVGLDGLIATIQLKVNVLDHKGPYVVAKAVVVESSL